ncbi:pectate lyase [Actinoplanes sp. SE50]|uniref:pectate lyase family protein n=1 Tax=unclassified Actinoplanes TaxID=2626549 RepID=UPI00023EC434|nr:MULTISPECIES: pectate lyase [unclassified Actinoplanes]AEV83596.1 Pectate lyase [Actinoplanes sp. SE50/110]ATO82260.1 pectate lyase [Actinoplanes sp. SE50]SLL99667.1 pectate lyase [Actinoplanes sp. SE50/110]
MKRNRIIAAAGTAVTAGVIAVALPLPQANAATAGATGYAGQNGGTTGGAGGAVVHATTGTQIHQALCSRATSSTPIVIQVEGTINHGNTTKVSGAGCNTAADKIELKQVSNVTIVGVGAGAVFDQLGIHIRDSSNIIIQNVQIQNVKKSGSPTSNGGDAIGMESTVRNVWVDHVNLLASGGEAQGYDSLIDMKDNTQYVTLSYSTLRNSGRGGLVGSSESDLGNGYITYHHNLYENIDSRTPLLRGGIAHIYNNYYVRLNKSGINSRAGAKARVDNNYFQDSQNVLGTFYTDAAGYWQVSGNIFDNVTWTAPDGETNPAGPDPVSNTSVSIPYAYTLDAASCVPAIVRQTAGANTGLKVSDGRCSTTSPSATGSPTPSATTPPSGTNLSLGAGADGSSKAGGTSYGNVKDGDAGTYWSPSGSTGDISIKWGSATTVSRVNVREIGSAVTTYRILNGATGAVLASGSGSGVITFPAVSLTRITFKIITASGTPRIAEFETYAS